MDMEVLECIKTRRSIRKYLKKPVPWDHVANILEAGRFAPSPGNLQNWKFLVVLDEDKRKLLAEASLKQFWMETAPIHIVIIADPEKARRHYGDRGERLYTTQGCAAAMENMMLEANNLGLGSCWVGAFDEEMVKRTLKCPPEVRPQAIITIGYSDEEVPIPTKFPLEAIMYFNKWRNKLTDIPAYFLYYTPKINRGLKKGAKTVQEGSQTVAVKAGQLAQKIKKKLEDRKKRKQEEINNIK